MIHVSVCVCVRAETSILLVSTSRTSVKRSFFPSGSCQLVGAAALAEHSSIPGTSDSHAKRIHLAEEPRSHPVLPSLVVSLTALHRAEHIRHISSWTSGGSSGWLLKSKHLIFTCLAAQHLQLNSFTAIFALLAYQLGHFVS